MISREDWESESSLDEDDVAAARDDHIDVAAQDWRLVGAFDCLYMQIHLNIDMDVQGRLQRNVGRSVCDILLAFFPLQLVEARFDHWRDHVQ
jgi:hypothetical protein